MNNILGISSQTGELVVKYSYDAYGKLLSTTGTLASTVGVQNPFLYKGYMYDRETGLYYCKSRYYNPNIGRWISPDAIEYLNPTSINGLNLYCYCNNNPIMYVDSDGNIPIKFSTFLSIFKWRNKDGSWSLYDNDRFEDKTSFHDQFFVINGTKPNFNKKSGVFGFGSLSFDLITAGWEWDNLDLSLLDFGHLEIGAEFDNGKIKLSAFASIYSPSISFNLGNIKVEISLGLGAYGLDFEFDQSGKKINGKFASGWGLGFSFDW